MLNIDDKGDSKMKFMFTTECCGKFVCNKDQAAKALDIKI